MKHIKLFETMAQYESYMDGEPIFPNVSYTEDNAEVHFLQSKPLATHFIYGNYYVDVANYFREVILPDLINISTRSQLYFNIEEGLLDGVNLKTYPWYNYLTTLTVEGRGRVTSLNFMNDGGTVYFYMEDNLSDGTTMTISGNKVGYFTQSPM